MTRNINEIESDLCSLDRRVKEGSRLISRQVYLLEQIQKTEEKIATIEQYKILDGSAFPFTSSMIALVLDYKSAQRREKGQDYRPFLLKNDLITRLAFEHKVRESIQCNRPFKYDVLLKNHHHISAMHLDFDGQELSLFFMDSSLDTGNIPYAESFKKYAKHVWFYTEGQIQYDTNSCAVFSIQSLNFLSHLSLSQKALLLQNQPQGGPLSLSPPFLKHTQGLSHLQPSYHENHCADFVDKKRQFTLEAYIDRHSVYVPDTKSTHLGENKRRNYAITYKKKKYLDIMNQCLNDIYIGPGDITQKKVDLDARIQNRFIFSDKNSYATEVDNDDEIIHRMFIFLLEERQIEDIQAIVQDALGMGRFDYIFDLIRLGATYAQLVGPYQPLIRTVILKGEVELVCALLDLAPDKNRDDRGESYLHVLVDQYRFTKNEDYHARTEVLGMFKQLIKQGLDVNTRDTQGQTPLAHLLSFSSDIIKSDEFIRLLLKSGASLSDLPKHYLTPEKLYICFREAIVEKDTRAFEHLLRLREITFIKIPHEKLQQLASQQRVTKMFQPYFSQFIHASYLNNSNVSLNFLNQKRKMDDHLHDMEKSKGVDFA